MKTAVISRLSVLTVCVVWLAGRSLAEQPLSEASLLRRLGIQPDKTSAEVFDRAVDAGALEKGVGFFVCDAVERCRAEAARMGKSANSIGGMAGHWLELALLVALKQRGLTPVYYQAELQNVPDAVLDIVVFSETRGPMVLSCKTSLRERYKQAEQEAVATRKAYPHSYSCIITLDSDKKHVARVRRKISDKEIQAVEAVYDETDLDALFALLAREKFIAPSDAVLRKARLVVR